MVLPALAMAVVMARPASYQENRHKPRFERLHGSFLGSQTAENRNLAPGVTAYVGIFLFLVPRSFLSGDFGGLSRSAKVQNDVR